MKGPPQAPGDSSFHQGGHLSDLANKDGVFLSHIRELVTMDWGDLARGDEQ